MSLIGLWIQAQDTLYIVEPDRSLDTGSGHIIDTQLSLIGLRCRLRTHYIQLSLIGIWIQAQDTLYTVESDRSLDTGSGYTTVYI